MSRAEVVRRHRRLADVCDAYLTPVVIMAVVVVSLGTCPEVVLQMSEIITSFLTFSAGICTGILVTFTLLGMGVLLLTKKLTATDHIAVLETSSLKENKKNEFVRADKSKKEISHPNILRKGKFASTIWIASSAEWDSARPLHKFPPPEDGTGDSKNLVKYYAEVKEGVLTFSCMDSMEKRQVMKIELDGCRCRIVDECLGTKSMWWRKGPLEISHPTRCLYQGCHRLFMFCLHGGDKEQWYVSLSKNMEGGDSIKVIQHLYKRYSKRCRQKIQNRRTISRSIHGKPIVLPRRGGNGEKGMWFTTWRRGNNGRGTSSSSEIPQNTHQQNVEFADDINQLWSGGKTHSAFAEELSRRPFHRPHRNRNGNNSNSTRTYNAHNTSSTLEQQQSKEKATPQQLPPSCVISGAPILAEDIYATAVSLLDHTSSGAGMDGREQQLCASLEGCSIESDCTMQEVLQPSSVLNNEANCSESMASEEVSLEDGIFGLNMFLARWGFDLTRNPDFEEKFRAMILKRLRGLRRPSYVMPLTLCSMDMGSNFPEIRSIRSLPPQGSVICPELLVDISYAGGLEVTIETSVDLREGSIWGTLDRTLASIQGTGANEKTNEEPLDAADDLADMPEDASDAEDQCSRERQATGFSVRKFAASKAKQLAERMAEQISKIPLRLSVKVRKLEGRMLLWISPPPAKRLWISFVEEPTFEVTAKPILANRVMKYSAALGRVSSWLQRKIKQSFFLNLVFPYCADMSFPGLLGLTDANGLKHPSSTLMQDLLQVSECDSDYSDSESRSPVQSPTPGIDPHVENASTSIGYAHAENSSDVSSAQVKLPEDERLATVRRSRYDTQRLNSFRRTWDGQCLTADQLPYRESHHGRRVTKRSLSMSDGDVSIGDDDKQIEADGVMSDCIEFFDPEPSATEITENEAELITTTTPSPLLHKTHEGASQQQIQWPSVLLGESGVDVGDMCTKHYSNRRLGSRFGDFVRNVQSAAAEEMEARRRRASQQSGGNNILKAAKQRAGEQRQKVRDVLENTTAQLKNSGLTRIWPQRRNQENKAQIE